MSVNSRHACFSSSSGTRLSRAASELARKVRLAPSRLRRSDPLHWQAELVLEDEVMVQARLIIRGQGQNQRALGAQLDVDAGGLQNFRRKRRPRIGKPKVAIIGGRKRSVKSSSLRWNDPDRFYGCDLSRDRRGTPGRINPKDGDFRLFLQASKQAESAEIAPRESVSG